MNPLFLIPVVLVIAGVCFMIFMNKKHSAAKTEIDLDVERTKYDTYKQELLTQDFSQLSQWMKGKSINAFTSASVPQSTANKVQEIVSDGIKNVALSAIGVKLKRIETDCFLALSGNDLHFFSTNTVGELDEHIVFDNFRIEDAQLQYGGVLKSQLGVYSKSSEEYLPKTHIITFNIDGSPLSLEIHDRLNYVPDPTDILNLKKQLITRAKYQVVGEKFVDILQDKFPNLKLA
ncbi:6TM ABC transporter family protein [Solitalea canadensis]|uniref:Uncharacterized protein n=1 Tax=Solitalea canadensis (strain ATCC 29591 / DSM 3403 / JCM 21819 / LMG 8368 / NBRC 15130 / NCIMB 12057 / USAM 9D) TaxID=929556 RepID=H8KTY8_SOLCM|nr:hypothetical protein [Solitalea canadensis]AFD06838.1 hypothetical protein Solca_1773 [Solitalea canadensis DSM 3403]